MAWVWAIAAAVGGLLFVPATFTVRFSFTGGPGERVVFELGVLGRLRIWHLELPPSAFAGRGVLGPLLDRVGHLAAAAAARPRLDRSAGGASEGGRPSPDVPGAASAAGRVVEVVWELVRRAYWIRLRWETTVGLRDAAATALAAGTLWALKANLASLARSRLRLAAGQPTFDVRPSFSGPALRSSLDGIAVLRVGHIMLALARLGLAAYRGRRAVTRRAPGPGRVGPKVTAA